MTKMFQTVRISIIADRIENKPTNHKVTMSGVTLDEAVDCLRGALKKCEEELEILKKVCDDIINRKENL